jgi:endo-1,4-beta-xylanase
VILTFFGAFPKSAHVVAQYSFEDSTQRWAGFYGASVEVTTAAAKSGTQSLLTTTNSNGTGGPGVVLTGLLLPGATYQISGYLMLTSGEAATSANFTMKSTDAACSGGTCYDTIGNCQLPATDSG